MPVAHDALIKGRRKVFDSLRKVFLEPDISATFLKPSATTNAYTEVAIPDSWWFEYDNFRQAFRLEVVDSNNLLEDVIPTATHISIDDDVYVIQQGDTLKPEGTDVTWKVFCQRFTTRDQFLPLY